jgi:hypothetical protein
LVWSHHVAILLAGVLVLLEQIPTDFTHSLRA